MIPTKEITPYVPISVNEVIEDVLKTCEFGVNMVHIHAREDDGTPTWIKNTYARIIEGIRKYNRDLVLCTSTSGRNWSEFEKRSQVLELDGDAKPDMASLTPSSLNFNDQASVTSPEMVQKLARKMKENGIKPELEAFDAGMINYAKYLLKKGLIEPPFFFTFILGNIACAQANILSLAMMKNELPENSYFIVGGVGNSQLTMNVEGLLNANGVRVGIEDMYYFDENRTKLATNVELIKRIRSIADVLGLEVATPKEVRNMLQLRELS
jgi:uncharacterized protein (DUF849 family)